MGANANLRELRKNAGLSQQQLATLSGCSLSTVRLYEGGYQPDSSDLLSRMLAAISRGRVSPPGSRDRYDVSYDQAEFADEADAVDWGVLVTDRLNDTGAVHVRVCAMSPETTARMLREAADAVEAKAGI